MTTAATPDGQRPLLTVEQVAQTLYGRSDRAAVKRAYLLIRKRALPARRVGKRWMVHVDNLDAYMRGSDDPDPEMWHPNSRRSA